jgi:hypothetical protein
MITQFAPKVAAAMLNQILRKQKQERKRAGISVLCKRFALLCISDSGVAYIFAD